MLLTPCSALWQLQSPSRLLLPTLFFRPFPLFISLEAPLPSGAAPCDPPGRPPSGDLARRERAAQRPRSPIIKIQTLKGTQIKTCHSAAGGRESGELRHTPRDQPGTDRGPQPGGARPHPHRSSAKPGSPSSPCSACPPGAKPCRPSTANRSPPSPPPPHIARGGDTASRRRDTPPPSRRPPRGSAAILGKGRVPLAFIQDGGVRWVFFSFFFSLTFKAMGYSR